jgi:hypothetical protein
VIAGTTGAEDLATRYLRDALPNTPTLEKALSLALVAWGIAREAALQEDRDTIPDSQARERLRDELQEAQLEVGLLERQTLRENRFRLIPPEQLQGYLRHL